MYYKIKSWINWCWWFWDNSFNVHCIDILRYLLGEYDRVNGINFNTSCIKMEDEDNCNVVFRFKNDSLGLISVSWCNEPSETLDIFGTKGFIKVDIRGRNPLSFGPKSLKRNEVFKNLLKFKPTNESAQNKLIDHIVNCIQTKKQESPNFIDGKKAVEFVLKAYSFKK